MLGLIASKERGTSLATMKKMFHIMNAQNTMHHKTYKQIRTEVRDAAQAATIYRGVEGTSQVEGVDQMSGSEIQVMNVSYDGA